ncbi:NAD(P)/FAD-dependent oxidoreductase [Polynucleobacter sp. AP-Melu-500A-A1]|uniref:NAD(P)/FAD-dependent oxidoreductase n=1 Tax=Polynucleobacter sp. AP-Melu-500A-A1 TaxID=2576929 RepID=UPI001C0D7FBA|nr:FAD-dependent oxidoreductase [Polynucleobacter sp. AP-Melu-500A-A1]MBU3631290.1 FAD-dependent oxidoreductase [Polynucleobacter sp. AP-Melu-500A-A1]
MLNASLKPSIAIIGAGLAGLSCAKQLQASGFKVQIFEKSRGPSGRMSTRNGNHWSADHGAQYFTARDPLFIEELNNWAKDGVAGAWHPRLKVFEKGQWRESTSIENRYVGIPAMNSPGKYLAKGLHITYSQTIHQIAFKDGKWTLHSQEDGSIDEQFDWLVLAIPAPQAFTLTNLIDQSIAEKNIVDMLGCWTVMATFTKKQDLAFDAAFINGEIISWISRNNSKPGREGLETWTIHANPQWSQQWIELDKDEAGKRILECAQGLGLDCQNAQISVHRWRYASGSMEASPGLKVYEDIHLGLCGDWLHGGRVEGAWLSGHQLANEISTEQTHLMNKV